MTIILSPKVHYSMQDEGSSLKLIIPSRKNYFTLFFLGFWLIGWAVGEIAVAAMFFTGKIPKSFTLQDAVLSLVWLIGWTLGGGLTLYTFLWILTGKENVEVSYDKIKIQRAVFGFGRTRQYLATHIEDLHIAPWSEDPGILDIFNGRLAFNYGSKKFRFGNGINEVEAKQILEKVIARFPEFRVRKSETG